MNNIFSLSIFVFFIIAASASNVNENNSDNNASYIQTDGTCASLAPSSSDNDYDEEASLLLVLRDSGVIKKAIDNGWLRKWVLLKNTAIAAIAIAAIEEQNKNSNQ